MINYPITTYELKGSVKDKLRNIELPEDAVPIGFDIIIKDRDTRNEYQDWWFYTILGKDLDSAEKIQREWVDDAHTEFVCVIDGKLKRYKVITRVYCMSPKPTGVSSNPDKATASETLVSTDGKTVHEEKRIICKRMNWKRASDCKECDDYQSCLCEVDSSEAQCQK